MNTTHKITRTGTRHHVDGPLVSAPATYAVPAISEAAEALAAANERNREAARARRAARDAAEAARPSDRPALQDAEQDAEQHSRDCDREARDAALSLARLLDEHADEVHSGEARRRLEAHVAALNALSDLAPVVSAGVRGSFGPRADLLPWLDPACAAPRPVLGGAFDYFDEVDVGALLQEAGVEDPEEVGLVTLVDRDNATRRMFTTPKRARVLASRNGGGSGMARIGWEVQA